MTIVTMSCLGKLKPRHQQHHTLKSLHVNGDFHMPEEYMVLLPLLESCRDLETCEVSGIQWVHQPQVNKVLLRLGMTLQKIQYQDLPNSQNSNDTKIAMQIHLSAHWKSIKLKHCNGVGLLTASAMLENCNHLV